MAQLKYALLESAAGYALFERKEGDELSSKLTEVQTLVSDFTRFARCVRLAACFRFRSPPVALTGGGVPGSRRLSRCGAG